MRAMRGHMASSRVAHHARLVALAGMKGGSATKMILEAIVSCAIASAFGVEAVPAAPVTLQRLPAQQRQLVSVLSEYERAVRMVYLHTEAIAEALRQGAEALRKGGRIVYVGDGSAAILGLVGTCRARAVTVTLAHGCHHAYRCVRVSAYLRRCVQRCVWFRSRRVGSHGQCSWRPQVPQR